jgi:uncharacterized protein YbjT (DUF2867 family)
MTQTDPLPFAVIGATGQQGGAVVDALLDAGEPVRALVRDPGSAKSVALSERGVTLSRADQEDPASLTEALRGVRGLFLMTSYDERDGGTEGETRRGRAVAESAARADVPLVVYSSVGGAERETGIPHFESKRRVEEVLTGLVPAVFVRPTFFMENLSRALGAEDAPEFVLRLPIPGDVPMQMVAVADIGQVSAAALRDPASVPGGSVEIAGDEVAFADAAALIGRQLGKRGRFEALPLSVMDGDSDRQAMFQWFVDTPGYRADFAATRRLDPEVLDLPGWLDRVTELSGAAR